MTSSRANLNIVRLTAQVPALDSIHVSYSLGSIATIARRCTACAYSVPSYWHTLPYYKQTHDGQTQSHNRTIAQSACGWRPGHSRTASGSLGFTVQRQQVWGIYEIKGSSRPDTPRTSHVTFTFHLRLQAYERKKDPTVMTMMPGAGTVQRVLWTPRRLQGTYKHAASSTKAARVPDNVACIHMPAALMKHQPHRPIIPPMPPLPVR